MSAAASKIPFTIENANGTSTLFLSSTSTLKAVTGFVGSLGFAVLRGRYVGFTPTQILPILWLSEYLVASLASGGRISCELELQRDTLIFFRKTVVHL